MLNRRTTRVGSGQTCKELFHGIFTFTAAGATASVTVPYGHVEAVVLTPIGTPAADEVLSVNNVVTGTPGQDRVFIQGANGATTLTVTRTGVTKTADLKFSLVALGW